MIKSFKHKGLRKFFESGNRKGIKAEHASKLARILDRLDASLQPSDMNLPGYKLHQLLGKDKGTWSVRVSGNWRVTFQFEDEDASVVDYRDYH
jgi:proteic killer suppression protein